MISFVIYLITVVLIASGLMVILGGLFYNTVDIIAFLLVVIVVLMIFDKNWVVNYIKKIDNQRDKE